MDSKVIKSIAAIREMRETAKRARLAKAKNCDKREKKQVKRAVGELKGCVKQHYEKVEESLQYAKSVRDPQARIALLSLELSRGRHAIESAREAVVDAQTQRVTTQNEVNTAVQAHKLASKGSQKFSLVKDRVFEAERLISERQEDDEISEVATNLWNSQKGGD